MEIKDRIILALDMDGTCVTHEFPGVGRDIGAVPWLKKFTDLGGLIILWTMRSDDPEKGRFVLTDAVNWFKERNIPLWGINKNPEQESWTTSPKVYGNLYVDDAAFGCPLIVSKIEGERPYVDWDIVGPQLVSLVE